MEAHCETTCEHGCRDSQYNFRMGQHALSMEVHGETMFVPILQCVCMVLSWLHHITPWVT